MATDHNFRIKNGLEVGGILIVNSSGALQVSPSTVSSNIKLNDSVQLQFGTGTDSNIRHDGNNTKFTHTGSGGLYIGADTFGIQNGAHNENYIMAAANGAVTVYYDGSLRLSTTSTGIKVEGAHGNATIGAQNTSGFHIYTDRDRFYFNKQISLITNTITSYDDDFVLKRVGSTKLTLTSTGVSVGGDLSVSGDLNITGDINSVSVTDLDVVDKTITVGQGQSASNSTGSGLVVSGANANMLWDNADNRWEFNKDVYTDGAFEVGNIRLYKSGDSNHLHIDAPTAIIGPSTTTTSNPSLGTSAYRFDGVFSSTGNFSGAITAGTFVSATDYMRITATGGSKSLLMGNQDSAGVNKPAMIVGVNGRLRFGHGSSWSTNGGTFTEHMNLEGGHLAITSGALKLGTTTVIDSSRKFYAADNNSTTNPTIAFTGHTTSGFSIYNDGSSDYVNIISGGGRRAYFNTAGITSMHNVYTASTSAFRNYGGVWAGTTGLANNGFYFLNTANSNTTKALEISHDGHGVFNKSLLVNGASDNGGKADFAVAVGGSHSQLSLYGAQVQAGSTDMNYNAKFFHDANGGHVAVWDNNLTFTIQGTNSGSASGRDIIFKPQVSGTAVATERMRIKGDGKVGIGTTSPNVKLAVDGQLSTGDRRLSLGILDLNSGSTPTQLKIITNIPFASGSADFTVNIKGFRYGTNDMVDLSIGWHYYNSTFYNASVISSGGYAPTVTLGVESSKVVIHLTSPGYWPKLYVESMYSSAYRDSYAAGWSWSDSAISSDSGTPTVSPAYSSNFGNNFVMLDNGNVGIGTSSPTDRLVVQSSGSIGGGATNANSYFTVTDGSTSLYHDPNEIFSDINGTFHIGANHSNGKLRFQTGGTTARMDILANGNVGIGTSTPAFKLDVNGNIRANGYIRVNSGGSFRLYNSAGNGWVQLHYDESNNMLNVQRGIKPGTDSSIDLGSSAYKWLSVYSDTIKAGNGSNSAPTYTFDGDTDTGMYRGSSNAIKFSTGGTQALLLDENQDASFAGYVTSSDYLQHFTYLYSRNNLRVLNSAGNGWHDWATRSNGTFNLDVGTISSGVITATGGNSTQWNTAYGWGNYASAPNAPSITSTSVVNETIEIVFGASTSTGNTAATSYEVWSDGGTGTDYSLIAKIPYNDIASSMSVVDSSFDDSGTIAYRVYAIRHGAYSTAATTTRSFSMPSLDVSSMSVIPDTNNYYIQYELPSTRFIDHIEIYKDVETSSSALSRSGAALIYSGNNSSYKYNISSSDMEKYHQFWVEVVTV